MSVLKYISVYEDIYSTQSPSPGFVPSFFKKQTQSLCMGSWSKAQICVSLWFLLVCDFCAHFSQWGCHVLPLPKKVIKRAGCMAQGPGVPCRLDSAKPNSIHSICKALPFTSSCLFCVYQYFQLWLSFKELWSSLLSQHSVVYCFNCSLLLGKPNQSSTVSILSLFFIPVEKFKYPLFLGWKFENISLTESANWLK